MQCERLINQIKIWYTNVRDETMAPARMVSFMEHHATTCGICVKDPDVKDEIAKITEMILPESKIPKAVRQQNQKEEEVEEEEVEEESEEEEEEEEDNNSETDEEEEEEALLVDDNAAEEDSGSPDKSQSK